MAITFPTVFQSTIATDPAATGAGYLTPARYNQGVAPAGLTASRILYAQDATTLTDSANLTYSETSGPRLTVGSGSTTSAGFILGYSGSSGRSNLWTTFAAPSASNFILQVDGNTILNSYSGNTYLATAGTNKAYLSPTAGDGFNVLAGTATTNVNALSATQTWNASGVTFTGIKFTITDTASAAGSLAMQILGGASGTTNLLSVNKGGDGDFGGGVYARGTFIQVGPSGAGRSYLNTSTGWQLGSSIPYAWSSNTDAAAAASDTGIGRAGVANSIVHAGTTVSAGAVTSRTEINKSVTAFTDAVAKTVFTLTIPNAAHSASYLVRLTGSIGAGGAIGANEASATNCYVVTLTRTAGVNATAAISAAFGAAASNVAGATTVTCTGALAAVSGAVGASNTIDIQATITKAGGSSDNHTCVATASLLNANASGVTIA